MISGALLLMPRMIIALNNGRTAARVGGNKSNSPARVLTRPGTTTRTVPSATSALSAAGPGLVVSPDRNRLSCSLSCEPASAAPTTAVASSSNKVQPSPIVNTSPTTAVTSARAYTRNSRDTMRWERREPLRKFR